MDQAVSGTSAWCTIDSTYEGLLPFRSRVLWKDLADQREWWVLVFIVCVVPCAGAEWDSPEVAGVSTSTTIQRRIVSTLAFSY